MAASHVYLIKTAPLWIINEGERAEHEGGGVNGGGGGGLTIAAIRECCEPFRRLLTSADRRLIACVTVAREFESYLAAMGAPLEHHRWYQEVKNKPGGVTIVPDAPELPFPFASLVMERGRGVGTPRHRQLLNTGFVRGVLTATSQTWAIELGTLLLPDW